jgi:two-component system response regulator HupR/HoxA
MPGDRNRHLVLLVEDEASVRETTAALLAETYEVVTAESGLEALRLLSQRRFDVVCTDYKMPGMDGAELLRRARERDDFIGGVLVTGLRDVETVAVRKLGCTVVLKPYEPAEMFSAIDRAAGLARMKRSVASARSEVDRALSLTVPPERKT